MITENQIKDNWLKNNNNKVFSYLWHYSWNIKNKEDYNFREDFFVVKDNLAYEINHDQTLRLVDDFTFADTIKLVYIGKYNPKKIYYYNVYEIKLKDLKKAAFKKHFRISKGKVKKVVK